MAYETRTITHFGGLNEVDPPDDVGIESAIDLSDVDWDHTIGSIRQRHGSEVLVADEGAPFTRIYAHSATRLLGARLNVVEAYDESGTSQGTTTVSGGNIDFATIGTPTATQTYIADGSGTLQRYTGTAFSSPAGLPAAAYIAVQPSDNRLVAAKTGASGGPGGATSSGSHVWFSNAGAPGTWSSTDYVILTPGDGEDIRAVVPWQNYVFVFKRSRIFIFYGNSVDAAGRAVFNYRTLELSNDLKVWGGEFAPVACTGPGGVYYAGEHGVFITTGDQPTRISDPLDWQDSNQSSAGFVASPAVAGERLYVNRRRTTNQVNDAFNQTAGALTGKAISTGGTWSGAGDTDDFTVDATNHIAQRTAVSDTGPRFAIAGTTTFTDCEVGVTPGGGLVAAPTTNRGLFARYVDASNYVRAYYRDNSAASSFIRVEKVVGGLVTYLGGGEVATLPTTMALSLTAAGAWRLSTGGVQFQGQDSALATGGTLALGRAGIYDNQTGTTAGTRTYDNFYAYEPSPGGIYVFDLRTGEWGDNRGLLTGASVIPWLDTETLYADHGTNTIRKLGDPNYEDADGALISSYWTSGFDNLGHESEKKLRYIDVWGTGAVAVSVATDYGDPENPETLTLGTDPAIARARYSYSAKGTLFGFKLASVAGAPWKVHRVTLHFSATKSASAVRPA